MLTTNKVVSIADDRNALPTENPKQTRPRSYGVSIFVRKYFLEGQNLDGNISSTHYSLPSGTDDFVDGDKHPTADDNYGWDVKRFVGRHPKLFAFLIPFGFMHFAWWALAFRYDLFSRYPTHFEMPITMILGATVAGMTSEGGGAVAFPVMTLLLNFEAKDARDFSLMIQSCGMTSAAFTIIWMGIKMEWNAIVIGFFGSTFGIIFGFKYVVGLLTGPERKMLFVAIWSSFAVSLFLLNSMKRRTTFENIQRLNAWKSAVLFTVGFIGGICSAFAGSGVDICSFSLLTLFFRISEKVATPTSVVLMAANTCVGFFWRELIENDISPQIWEYFSVSVPVVVICAPMGSLIASHFHRLVLAGFVYVLEIAAVIGFLITGPETRLIWMGAIIVLASFIFFNIISKIGGWIHADFESTKPSYKGLGHVVGHKKTTDANDGLLFISHTN